MSPASHRPGGISGSKGEMGCHLPFFVTLIERNQPVSDDSTDPSGLVGQIETARLVLRPPARRDQAAMATLADSAAVMESLAALPRPTPEFAGEAFAIVEKKSGTIIGSAIYGPIVDRPAATEIACWIGELHRGVGYATEAVQAVIDRAFADATLTVLWCSHRVMNAQARRVIEKCGFQLRETGMGRSPATRGAVPVERFVLERRNWRALRRWGTSQQSKDRNGTTRDTAA